MALRANPEAVKAFARFVIDQGHGAVCSMKDQHNRPITWQARGRQLYGTDEFNKALLEEIEARKAKSAAPGAGALADPGGEAGGNAVPSQPEEAS